MARFRDSLLLLVYILLSSFFMLSSDSIIVEGIRSSTLITFGFMQDNITSVNSYFGLHEANRNLRAENTRLAYENYQLQDALLENIRLKNLLHFKYDDNYQLIAARILGHSPLDFITGYLLSIFEPNIVRKNSAVIAVEGLVGKIVKLSGSYATCQNLLDPNSKVSVRIQRNRELGIVSWDGSAGLMLENVPNTIEVIKGDVLFTSGMSRIYPPNIKIGHVTKVVKNEEELFQTISVQPAVNFNNIEEIFIIQTIEKNETRN